MTRTALLVTLSLLANLGLGCPDTGDGGPFSGGPFDDGNGDGGEGGYGDDPYGTGSGIEFTDRVGPDGCEVVALDSSSWPPIHASWSGGADPFFHLHSNERAFYFSIEAYTEYGAGWAGEVGTFEPLCGANGLCVYLASDDFGTYRATAGDVDIVALGESGGSIDRPAEVHFRNLTLTATEDGGAEGCLHLEEASLIAR